MGRLPKISAKRLKRHGGKVPASTFEPKKPKPRFERGRDPAFLTWIRMQRCAMRLAVPYHFQCCHGPIEAAHIKSRGAGGSDFGNVIPLDRASHRRQHDIGIRSWAKEYGLTVADLKRLAREYADRYQREQGAAR